MSKAAIMTRALLAALMTVLVACAARADDTITQGDATNSANNPLTAETSLNLQNYYTPSFYGPLNSDANSLLLRGLVPLNFGGVQQLVRFTLPYSVNPSPDRYGDGLGDLTVFDLIVLPSKPVLLAVGPLFVAPTATDRFTGAGRWQAGAAAAAVSVQSWGLVGALLTYQHSFADDFGRAPTSLLTAQPIVFYNLPHGFYLRSSGIWNFDFENDLGYIPVGLGAGKVMRIGKVTANFFVEPQYTVYHYGQQVPHWQIFRGHELSVLRKLPAGIDSSLALRRRRLRTSHRSVAHRASTRARSGRPVTREADQQRQLASAGRGRTAVETAPTPLQ